MAVHTGLPTSSLFEVRQTPHCGRAIFATQDILAGTPVWRSEDLVLDVLLREYRREVCGECFSYDYGRDLKKRDQAVGFAFCSDECQVQWRQRLGEVGVQAWIAVETLIKGRSKEDADMVDVGLPRPKPAETTGAWNSVAQQAVLIRIAREGAQNEEPGSGLTETDKGVKVTRKHRKALQSAIAQPISPDVMSFCLSGILWLYNNPQDLDNVLALAEEPAPYHSVDDLRAFTRTYLHLLAILPRSLLPLVTAESLLLFSSRDSHNSFGIRSLEDEGSEFFGYGCWPAASYFNHSCSPSIEKNREGRAWQFKARREIKKGEELCITYLSGEERRMGREDRVKRLQSTWGFECNCARCKMP